MSINISADIMISDLFQLIRLIQRTGRLCRFDKNKLASCMFFIPEKNESIYPAPYGEYDRKNKCWISSEPFDKTKEIINCERYSVEKLINILNQIYLTQGTFSVKAISNAKNLKEYFKQIG